MHALDCDANTLELFVTVLDNTSGFTRGTFKTSQKWLSALGEYAAGFTLGEVTIGLVKQIELAGSQAQKQRKLHTHGRSTYIREK